MTDRGVESRSKGGTAPVVFSVLASVFTACGAELASPGDAFTVRDSAGVTIAENWTRAPLDTFQVADAPTLIIGREGQPAYEFAGVAGVVLLDGSVVVGDGTSNEVRYYDERGEHRRSVGGDGQGPGEFAFLNRVFSGDLNTVYANDARNRRLVMFGGGGEFLGEASYVEALTGLDRDGDQCRFPGFNGRFDDGRILGQAWSCVSRRGGAAPGLRPDADPFRAQLRFRTAPGRNQTG